MLKIKINGEGEEGEGREETKMHIKIDIPRQRKGYGSSLGPVIKQLTIPLEEISLKTLMVSERVRTKKPCEKYCYDEHVNIRCYYLYIRNREEKDINFKEYEINEVEYNRIVNILEKMNLLEVKEHNERAINEGVPEKIISRGEINGLLGLEVE